MARCGMRTASSATRRAIPSADDGDNYGLYHQKASADFYYVKTGWHRGMQRRGIFRKRGITPVAGDCELFLPTVRSSTRSGLAKCFHSSADRQLDILFIVTSVQPVPSTLVLDQLAAAAIYKDVQPVLVVTKADLAAADMLRTAYAGSDIPLVQLNYETGGGSMRIKAHISGSPLRLLRQFWRRQSLRCSTRWPCAEPGDRPDQPKAGLRPRRPARSRFLRSAAADWRTPGLPAKHKALPYSPRKIHYAAKWFAPYFGLVPFTGSLTAARPFGRARGRGGRKPSANALRHLPVL